MEQVRAVLVCVDYADLLAITLPYNRHHFSEVHVITSFADNRTPGVAVAHGAEVWQTDLFYENGADFNKWRALEACLDHIGRDGWLCLMDADVLWPKSLDGFQPQKGNIYTPRRRMLEDLSDPIPSEGHWAEYPLHRNETEFAGYSQLLHGSDEILPPPPWHDINWRHAGGADSFFQALWPAERKIRPPFEVLHLGPAGVNWCGRSSALTDGSVPDEAKERQQRLQSYFRNRRRTREVSTKFQHEKLN